MHSPTSAALLGATAVLLVLCQPCAAQTYPTKSIRIVDAFAPGGTTDILGRLIASKLTPAWGQQVVVENRPGANGIIGSELVARAAPDGYTMMVGSTATLAVNQSLYKLKFDPLKDYDAVTMLASQPLILVVHPSVPVQTVTELIALVKKRPGELAYASPGIGNPLHLAGELFRVVTQTSMIHVPYNRGSAAAMPDLLGGQVQAMFAPTLPVIPHIQSGKLRALAVTGAQRSTVEAVKAVPTVREAGVPGYEVTIWNAMVVPAGTPRDIVGRLNAEVRRIMEMPDIRERLIGGGVLPVTSSPEEQTRFTLTEVAKWAQVIKEAAIKVE
jgi:tripartite-type tricarboxylate transporter receptor subunit TctC